MRTKSMLAFMCAAVGAALISTYAADTEHEKGKADLSKIPPASAKTGVTYAADIKPIFDHSCIKCHGAEKPKGKLRLDSLEGALKGGQDGKVIEPGDGAHSILVQNIAHVGDEDDYMPPPKNKVGIAQLTKEQIGLVRAWIDQGAK